MTYRFRGIRQVQGCRGEPGYCGAMWKIKASLPLHWRVRVTVVWGSPAGITWGPVQGPCQSTSSALVFHFWSFYRPGTPMVYSSKEAYAVMGTVERMHWLLATSDGFDVYNDPQNLIFLFDPLGVDLKFSQTSLPKILRLAVRERIKIHLYAHQNCQ